MAELEVLDFAKLTYHVWLMVCNLSLWLPDTSSLTCQPRVGHPIRLPGPGSGPLFSQGSDPKRVILEELSTVGSSDPLDVLIGNAAQLVDGDLGPSLALFPLQRVGQLP